MNIKNYSFVFLLLSSVLLCGCKTDNISEERKTHEKSVSSSDISPFKIKTDQLLTGKVFSGFEIIKSANKNTNDWAQEIRHKFTGIEMVYVPSGIFEMGALHDDKNIEAHYISHTVTITKPFYIGKYEITQGQWETVMGNNPSVFGKCVKDFPVENVSWEDCQDFLEKLNQNQDDCKFRLPYEAEWEFSAKGSINAEKFPYSGSENLNEVAWYVSNSMKSTHPIGEKKTNALNICDMSGNVWEWCQDRYGHYSAEPETDPEGAGLFSSLWYNYGRVVRGGCWASNSKSCTVVHRYHYDSATRLNIIGFRVCIDITAE